MKNGKAPRKIQLNRESLRRLTTEQAEGVAGGISVGTCTACRETYCVCPPPRISNNPLAC